MSKQSNAIELIETKGRDICETTPRYKVMFNGVMVDELRYNMRGYVGFLPYPSDDPSRPFDKLDIGEKNITAYRMEVKKLNKQWREQRATPTV